MPGIQLALQKLLGYQDLPLIANLRNPEREFGKVADTVFQQLRRILDLNPLDPLLGIRAFDALQLAVIILDFQPFPQKRLQEIAEDLGLGGLLPQIGKYGGDVGAEDVVVGQDQYILGLYGLPVAVEDIGQAVEAYAGLSAARQAVDQAGALGVAAYGRVLLPLDAACDDLQLMVGIFRKGLNQDVVVHGGIRVVHGEQAPILYPVLPLPRDLHLVLMPMDLVPGRACIKLIEHGGNGGPPVHHVYLLGLLIRQAVDSDVDGVRLPRLLLEIHAAEIGGFLHFGVLLYIGFIPCELLLHGFHYRLLGVQEDHIVKIPYQMPVVLPHLLPLPQQPLLQRSLLPVQLLQFVPDDSLHFVKMDKFLLKIVFFH